MPSYLALMLSSRSQCILSIGFMWQLILVPVVFAQSQVDTHADNRIDYQIDRQAGRKPVTFSKKEIAAIRPQGPWPGLVPHDPGNELSGLPWAEVLGKILFFDSTLSADGSISCATCHLPELGFSDNRPVALGLEGGVRNTQGLLDVGLHRWFGWGGGTDSLWAASIRPLLDENEMGNDVATLASTLRANTQLAVTVREYLHDTNVSPSLVNSVLGADVDAAENIGIDSLSDEELIAFAAKSMAAYVRTLRSKQTAFDRFRSALANNDLQAQMAYPDSAKRGLKIFMGDANCRSCHFGPNFSNGEFHDTGRPFFTGVGKVDSGRYAGIKRVREDQFNLLGKYGSSDASVQLKTSSVKLGQLNWGQWRTPSLRNLEATAPYMHDGSLKTLRDVVDAYADIDMERLHTKGESILKPLDLNHEQRDDLVNFLRSLSTTD